MDEKNTVVAPWARDSTFLSLKNNTIQQILKALIERIDVMCKETPLKFVNFDSFYSRLWVNAETRRYIAKNVNISLTMAGWAELGAYLEDLLLNELRNFPQKYKKILSLQHST
jgi:hypothetical protein